MKTATAEPQLETRIYKQDTVLRFEEGLIGFADYKNFVLLENAGIEPLRVLQFAGSPDVAFFVLDPKIRVADYYNQVPTREWESLGITDPAKYLAFVVVNIGLNAKECTANFQAPILVNYETMNGRQIILTDSGFCVRHPIVG
jgi:flagellar assembly factor FliW